MTDEAPPPERDDAPEQGPLVEAAPGRLCGPPGSDRPRRRRVSAAWAPFTAALARTLAVLEDEQYLVLGA